MLKEEYNQYNKKGGKKSYESWIKMRGFDGLKQKQGGGLLTEELVKGAAKGLYNLGRIGASKAIKSNYAKKK